MAPGTCSCGPVGSDRPGAAGAAAGGGGDTREPAARWRLGTVGAEKTAPSTAEFRRTNPP